MFEKIFEVIQWAFDALLPVVIVMPYERGVLIRLGIYKRDLDPGLHWCWPLHFDVVHKENVVTRTERISGLATTTSDGKSVGFDVVITYSISDIRKALLEVDDLQDAVADTCAGIIGTELAKAEWSSIRNGEVTEDLAKICRKRGWKYGIEINAVQLVGIALVKNIRISGHPGGESRASSIHLNLPSA